MTDQAGATLCHNNNNTIIYIIIIIIVVIIIIIIVTIIVITVTDGVQITEVENFLYKHLVNVVSYDIKKW